MSTVVRKSSFILFRALAASSEATLIGQEPDLKSTHLILNVDDMLLLYQSTHLGIVDKNSNDFKLSCGSGTVEQCSLSTLMWLMDGSHYQIR